MRQPDPKARFVPPNDYLSLAGPRAPGVVVVHDWYGLLPHVRRLCDDLAAAGLTALAVDLYDGESTADDARAEQLMDTLDPAEAQRRVAEAVRRLRGAEALAPRICGLGFSMGGWVALHGAAKGLFDAVVGYYTALNAGEETALPCPLLLHLSELDDWDPPDQPERFAAEVNARGGSAQVVTHAGTQHGFANADVAAFAPEAAEGAWQATLEFLGGRRRH